MTMAARVDWVEGEYIPPEPMTPPQVEAAIQWCMEQISRGVHIVTDAQEKALKADREYDRAYAQAYLVHEGPAHAKKYAAELATEAERDARDVAELAYRHAQRVARRLDTELSGYQSLNKSMQAAYGATTGYGGR